MQILGDDNTNSRFFLIKIKEDNTIIWKNEAKGIGTGMRNKYITVSPQGDIYTSGNIFAKMQFDNHIAEIFDEHIGISDVYLNKYNSEGKLSWMKVYGYKSDNDFTNGLKYNSRNNKLYFTSSFKPGFIFGDTVLSTTGRTDGFLAEMDTSGKFLKLIVTRGENTLCISNFEDFDMDNNGNLYLGGSLNFMVNLGDIMLTTTSKSDAFLWKVSNWPATSGINKNNNYTSNSTSDLEVSPNPATDRLRFSNIRDASSLQIFSMDGRMLINRPVNGQLQQEGIDVSNLPNGMYFINVLTPTGKQSAKFIKQQ